MGLKGSDRPFCMYLMQIMKDILHNNGYFSLFNTIYLQKDIVPLQKTYQSNLVIKNYDYFDVSRSRTEIRTFFDNDPHIADKSLKGHLG